jgi:tRNA(fMet)-specific endonuclease VapC
LKEALLDTDILSYYFKGDAEVVRMVNEYLSEYEQLNISIITFYEIIAGLKYKRAEKQLQEFELFVSNNNILHITEISAKISGNIYANLRQEGITIGTSDILIAGIAIDNDLTLITNNLKHYEPIKRLSIENWRIKD